MLQTLGRSRGTGGSIAIAHLPRQQSLSVTVSFADVQALPAIINRVRRVFDVGADIETIDQHLSQDPYLAPWVARPTRPSRTRRLGWF